ncbi:PAS domain-containing protein [Methanoculleus chikugoensis]|uniref:PAS domain-containing protein n=1 Tax=Methanoculleus chikugoensis TaxID=118126 RepID=UPI000AEEE6FA|nr:PAS domain-containing protein [Methanoculleus chikugoensis]
MQPERDIPGRVLRTLKFRPKGMTITEIAKALRANRNSVSKHLEVMQAAGQVEARLVGNAKVYSVAQRIPLSAFLCFTKNLILVLDADLTIVQANDQCLRRFGRAKEEFVGQNLREAALPVVSSPEALTVIEGLEREQVITDICHRHDGGRESFYHMQAIPTTFEGGEKGCTLVLEDITERKQYTRNTAFLARTAIDLVDLQPVEDIYGYILDRLRELVPVDTAISSPTARPTTSSPSGRSRMRDSGRGSRNSWEGTPPSTWPSRPPAPSTPPITRLPPSRCAAWRSSSSVPNHPHGRSTTSVFGRSRRRSARRSWNGSIS